MRKTSGLSLLLLIFLSLCLVTFSLLSVSESSADRKLSEKAAQHTTDYYHALSEANEILAKIDDVLSGYVKDAASSDTPAKTYLKPAPPSQICSLMFRGNAPILTPGRFLFRLRLQTGSACSAS